MLRFPLKRTAFTAAKAINFTIKTTQSMAFKSSISSSLISRNYSITTNGSQTPLEVNQLSTNEYHKISEEYLETLTDHLEELSEANPTIDAEYSQGVLTLELPPNGVYVINKQPPNKQIWLSSPISGPDRFDPINGKWISLRTHESLGDILRREISAAIAQEVKLEGLDD